MSTVMDEQAMLISIIVDAVMNKCMMSKSTLVLHLGSVIIGKKLTRRQSFQVI